ncbi:MAG: zinc ribbon-containing protein [Gammaproteobacteria bacterium]
MNPKSEHSPAAEKLIRAYNRMLERVKAFLDDSAPDTHPGLHRSIDSAKDKAVELGELTREEAERTGYFLKRDLEDAARYLADTGHELSDWLQIDAGLIERQMLEWFGSAADRTRLEWLQLQADLRRTAEYHTGEIAGPGALECSGCGEVLRLQATGHVPPCPRCHGTLFRRPANRAD